MGMRVRVSPNWAKLLQSIELNTSKISFECKFKSWQNPLLKLDHPVCFTCSGPLFGLKVWWYKYFVNGLPAVTRTMESGMYHNIEFNGGIMYTHLPQLTNKNNFLTISFLPPLCCYRFEYISSFAWFWNKRGGPCLPQGSCWLLPETLEIFVDIFTSHFYWAMEGPG